MVFLQLGIWSTVGITTVALCYQLCFPAVVNLTVIDLLGDCHNLYLTAAHALGPYTHGLDRSRRKENLGEQPEPVLFSSGGQGEPPMPGMR